MFFGIIVLLLAAMGDGGLRVEQLRESLPLRADYQAVLDLATLDLGAISEPDAAHWTILRVNAGRDSGTYWQGAAMDEKTGKLIELEDEDKGCVATKGLWECISPLVGPVGTGAKGEYHFMEPQRRDSGGMGVKYSPLYDGATAFVLAEHFPEKTNREQFGKIVVLSEDVSKSFPTAFRFRREHAELFGKRLRKPELVELLGGENPVTAIVAAQRLAQARQLDAESLRVALDGAADFRRAVIPYLAFTSSSLGTGAGELHRPSITKFPPEWEMAIGKADFTSLRYYLVALSHIASRFYQEEVVVPAFDCCRKRADALKPDAKMRKQLAHLLADPQERVARQRSDARFAEKLKKEAAARLEREKAEMGNAKP